MSRLFNYVLGAKCTTCQSKPNITSTTTIITLTCSIIFLRFQHVMLHTRKVGISRYDHSHLRSVLGHFNHIVTVWPGLDAVF